MVRALDSRVIRVDDEVYAELERRVVRFGENPNTVLQRILGLEAAAPVPPAPAEGGNDEGAGDSRIEKLLRLVDQFSGGRRPPLNRTTQGYGMASSGRRRFGFIYPQRQRLSVEIRGDAVERAGLKDWNRWLLNGWFNTGIPSAYWFVPDGDEGAYRRVAQTIARLMEPDG